MIKGVFLGCTFCKHFMPNGTCKAFPKGIPFAIEAGQTDHLKPLSNQIGDTVFEQSEAFVNF